MISGFDVNVRLVFALLWFIMLCFTFMLLYHAYEIEIRTMRTIVCIVNKEKN